MRHVALALTLTALTALWLARPAAARPEAPHTDVRDPGGKQRLVGKHGFSLQWISWEQLGSAVVSEDADGTLRLKGEQRAGEDFVTIDGVVTSVDATAFTFEGEIVTRVSHINGGRPCTRQGPFTFARKGKRRYWRLQQMDNPCEGVTDYVDVYLK
jgi:hypothetical protein